MAKRKIKEIKGAIKYLKNLLEKKGLEIDKIILFGSYARGDYKEDSDIDVVVVSEAFKGKGIFEKAKLMGDVEWKLVEKYPIPLDIITMSPEDLKKGVSPTSQYAKEGEVIYRK